MCILHTDCLLRVELYSRLGTDHSFYVDHDLLLWRTLRLKFWLKICSHANPVVGMSHGCARELGYILWGTDQ
jgi:hypothetical protein